MFVVGISIFILTLLIAIFGPLFYHVDINARDIVAGPYAGSSADHLLGTDHLGRDYVSLLIGSRLSVSPRPTFSNRLLPKRASTKSRR